MKCSCAVVLLFLLSGCSDDMTDSNDMSDLKQFVELVKSRRPKIEPEIHGDDWEWRHPGFTPDDNPFDVTRVIGTNFDPKPIVLELTRADPVVQNENELTETPDESEPHSHGVQELKVRNLELEAMLAELTRAVEIRDASIAGLQEMLTRTEEEVRRLQSEEERLKDLVIKGGMRRP